MKFSSYFLHFKQIYDGFAEDVAEMSNFLLRYSEHDLFLHLGLIGKHNKGIKAMIIAIMAVTISSISVIFSPASLKQDLGMNNSTPSLVLVESL